MTNREREAIFHLVRLEEALRFEHMDSEAEAVRLGIYAIGTNADLRKERDVAIRDKIRGDAT